MLIPFQYVMIRAVMLSHKNFPPLALLSFAILIVFCTPAVFAEQARKIHANGTLELDNGLRAIPAGLKFVPEGVGLMRLLIAGKELELRYERSQGAALDPAPAYIHLKSHTLKLPFKLSAIPEEEKIMVNEFLLAVGAARVDRSAPFKEQERFLKIEEEARRRGEGLWSYEES